MHLDQIVVSGFDTASGNVLEDDVLGSAFTKLQVTQDGVSFVDADAAGTQIVGSYGTLTIYANGDYSYQPNGGLSGIGNTDQFTYRLEHPNGTTSDATLTIDVEHGTGPEAPAMNAAMAHFMGAAEYDVSLDGLSAADEPVAADHGEPADAPRLDELLTAEAQSPSIGGFLGSLADEEGGAHSRSDAWLNGPADKAADASGIESDPASSYEPLHDALDYLVPAPHEDERNENII